MSCFVQKGILQILNEVLQLAKELVQKCAIVNLKNIFRNIMKFIRNTFQIGLFDTQCSDLQRYLQVTVTSVLKRDQDPESGSKSRIPGRDTDGIEIEYSMCFFLLAK